jgi:hypothetical protein
MAYDCESSGPQVSAMVPVGGRDDFYTFAMVEERLVEAMLLWRRADDAEARFCLRGRISSIWRMALSEPAFVDIKEAELKPLPLSRGDVARMTEASEWIAFVAERDRKLVMAALAALAGGRSQVPWLRLKAKLGVKFGAEGLRKRYSRSITKVTNALNAAENRQGGVSSRQMTPPSK